MIIRMLNQPLDKNELQNEQNAYSVIECTAEYKIDNQCVYDMLDQICKNADVYPYVKQHMSKRDCRGAFMPSFPCGYTQIMPMGQHQRHRWHFKHVLMIEKRRHEDGKSMFVNMSSTMIFYETLWNMGTKASIQDQKFDTYWMSLCDKLSMAVATARAHSDKCKKDFDTVVAFLTQDIDKRAQTSVWRLPPFVIPKERVSWRSVPARNMTQWHSVNSYTSRGL